MFINNILTNKKIFLWDFDGCCCDSEPAHYLAYAKAFADYGHIVQRKEYFNNFTHTGAGAMQEIIKYKLSCDPNKIREKKNKYYAELIIAGEAKLFPEIEHILLKLSQLNIKNVIASNSSQEEIELILSQAGENIKIDKIFGLKPGLQKKPAPDIFNYALSIMGISSQEALVIEDSHRGLLAAQAANCEAIWLKTYLNKDFISDAPYIANITHAELWEALK